KGCGGQNERLRSAVALVQQAVLVGDGLLDAGGLVGAGQLAHQLQPTGDGTAQAVAGGDVAVHDHLLVQHLGAGQLVLERGVGGGRAALQQAPAGQDAGGGADGGHLLAGGGHGLHRAGDGGAGGQVGGAGDAAGQDHQVHTGVVDVLGQGVGGDGDLVAAGDGQAARRGRHGHLHLGPAQKVNDEKGLAFLGALGEKDNCFAHESFCLP